MARSGLEAPLGRYRALLNTAPVTEVRLGWRGVRLYGLDEVDEWQIDDPEDFDGTVPTGEDEACEPIRYVVGRVCHLGDPICLDLGQEALPVFTAPRDTGFWQPELVADSFSGFLHLLEEVKKLSAGRTSPVRLAANPIPEDERQRFLEWVGVVSPRADLEFWESWFEA